MQKAATRKGTILSIFAALLILASLCLIALHLQVDYNTLSHVITASSVNVRRSSRIQVDKPSGTINVNTANAEELQAISGVGRELASRIIAERERNGMFYYAEDLLNVKGIGAKTLQKILTQICLE